MANIPVNFNTNPNLDINLANKQTLNGSIDSDAQQIDALFNVVNNVNLNLDNTTEFTANFGDIYMVDGNNRVLYATTATWNSQPSLKAKEGYIYIYADYRQNDEGQNIPSMKIGDGNAYLIDMPFADQLLYDHLRDEIRHITQEERKFWNNKVRCYIDESNDGHLIFTTH